MQRVLAVLIINASIMTGILVRIVVDVLLLMETLDWTNLQFVQIANHHVDLCHEPHDIISQLDSARIDIRSALYHRYFLA
jgi:hypothetical protein